MFNLFKKTRCGACGKTKYFTKIRVITPKKVPPKGLLNTLTSQEPLCRDCYKIAKNKL